MVAMSCRCAGYQGCAHRPGACPGPGGGHVSALFCRDCDPRRIVAIAASVWSTLSACPPPADVGAGVRVRGARCHRLPSASL